MAKSRNANIPVHSRPSDYNTWDTQAELKDLLSLTQNYQAVGSRNGRIYKDVDTNTSVRPGYTRDDYEYFRPDEALPQEQQAAIAACMKAYQSVGLIQNVIDLMGDFACQGVGLVHPNPKIEKFYKNWFSKINGKERSERFLNLLYRTGNVIVKRSTANLRISKNVAKMIQVNASTPTLDMHSKDISLAKNEIPWKYHFINPLSIELVGEELAKFVGKPTYAIKIPHKIISKINNPSNQVEKDLVAQLPPDLVNAVKNGQRVIVIDQSKLSVYHYKKDDWLPWAYPMTYAILKDIWMYDKLKLTDMAACDSAISAVRMWRVGSLEHRIFPAQGAIDRLSNMLNNNVGGGSMDLVVGPEIEFHESNSAAYKFLGEAKYGPTLNAIYAGLGIPPTLTGSATSSGFTNNYISLKTLTERLAYGRTVLTQFWEQEIALVQKAMGFKLPATIRFERMTLSDESAEKALLIQLVDRDLISMESVLERFDEIPELEKRRIRREYKERNKDTMPDKASPYHKPDHKRDMEKSFVQQGTLTPGEVGVSLRERKAGEKSNMELQLEAKKAQIAARPKGTPGQGRPKTSKDSSKRKTKVVKPRSSAASAHTPMVDVWARNALATVAKLVTPGVLAKFGKKNLRGLSKAEVDNLEMFKFGVLMNLEPLSEVTDNTVIDLIDRQSYFLATEELGFYKLLCRAYQDSFHKEPSIEDLRQIQIMVYTKYRTEEK